MCVVSGLTDRRDVCWYEKQSSAREVACGRDGECVRLVNQDVRCRSLGGGSAASSGLEYQILEHCLRYLTEPSRTDICQQLKCSTQVSQAIDLMHPAYQGCT